jgi:hypothetical protein
MESEYFVCTERGKAVQGPFGEGRVRELIAEGRMRADMWFCEDGSTWVQGRDLPDLFPAPSETRSPGRPPPQAQAVAAPPRREVPVRAAHRRAAASSAAGPSWVRSPMAMLGIGVLVGMAIMAGAMFTFGGIRVTSNPDLISNSDAGWFGGKTTGATRAAFLERIGWNGYVLSETREEFLSKAGKPHSTQKIGDDAYWYYRCTDGQLQVVMQANLLQHGRVLITEINEY